MISTAFHSHMSVHEHVVTELKSGDLHVKLYILRIKVVQLTIM